MIVYFSGTGNSRYVAQLLAVKLKDEIVDAGKLIKEGRTAKLKSKLPWVFAAPTYGWQIPHVFQEWIRKGEFQGSTKAYFVMTCGSDIGGAGTKLSKLCAEKRFQYCGVLQAVMPENYIAMFPVTGEAESARLLAAAEPLLEKASQDIIKGQPFEERPINLMDKAKTAITNPIFYKLLVTAKPFHVTDACTGCGKCKKLCPLNNVSLSDGKPQWGKNCTHCMACICYCPTQAIEYGKASLGKRRYQCEEYREGTDYGK